MRVCVSDQRTADEIHRRVAEVPLQYRHRFSRIDGHGGHTRSIPFMCAAVASFAVSLGEIEETFSDTSLNQTNGGESIGRKDRLD